MNCASSSVQLWVGNEEYREVECGKQRVLVLILSGSRVCCENASLVEKCSHGDSEQLMKNPGNNSLLGAISI
jgi:hypothetical protein